MIKPYRYIAENDGAKIEFYFYEQIESKGKSGNTGMKITIKTSTGQDYFQFKNSTPSTVHAIGKCLIETAEAAEPNLKDKI